MSYETVLEQVKTIPEKYLPEVSDFLSYVQYKSKILEEEQSQKDIKIFESMQQQMSSKSPWKNENEMLEELSEFRKKRIHA